MAAGLPKDPLERARSIGVLFPLQSQISQRGAPSQIRCPDASTDASLGTVIGRFSLRGEAQSIGI